MAELSKEQKEFYTNTLNQTREQIKAIDQQIEEEIENFKKKMEELKSKRKVIKQIYDGAATLLGVPDEFADEEEEAEEI